MSQVDLYWDKNIKEYEVDPSWKDHAIYKTEEYKAYRQKWSNVSQGKMKTEFPLNIEMEPTYYCNLKCPFCPRTVNSGERESRHMDQSLWKKILHECKENDMPAIQLDHEAESMMNPKLFDMLKESTDSGIFDTWLHTNGQMLSEKNGRKLIEGGLKKLNISIDAYSKTTYEKIRVGGNYEKLINNVQTFLRLKKEYKADYLRVRVSFVEQRENFHEKKDFYNFWKKFEGINTITFQRCMDLTPFESMQDDKDNFLTEEELDKKYENQKPFYCYAPWETPTIEENGKIAPCLKPVREHNKDFYIGDLSKGDTIKKAWNSEKMNKLRDIHSKGQWYKNPMCRMCVKVTREAQHEDFDPNK
tara:strand:+ start:422 stop:1498 length:1077 start_codon:yes stop_codon:yes gene_type:complete